MRPASRRLATLAALAAPAALAAVLALSGCTDKRAPQVDPDRVQASATPTGAAPADTPPPVGPNVTAPAGKPGSTRAAVYTRLERDGAGSCANPGTVLAFGSFTDEAKPETVAQGESIKEGPVAIACKIARSGLAYTVEAKISVPSLGELSFSSPVDGEGRSAAAKVSLTTPGEGTWTSDRCALEPSMLQSGGIGPGHYAAAIKCASAVNAKTGASPLAGTVFLQNCADH
jgi:hypothetical protein